MGDEKGLRADAPVFVPSFKDQREVREKLATNYNSKQQSNNSSTRKKQQRRKNDNKRGGNRTKTVTGIVIDKDEETKANNTEQRKLKKRNNRQRRIRRQSDKRNSSTRSQRKKKEFGDDDHNNNVTTTTLPLNEESLFPSLVVEESIISTSSTNVSSVSRIWVDSTHNPEIFLPPPSLAEETIIGGGEASDTESGNNFRTMGLHKLTSSRRKQGKQGGQQQQTKEIQKTFPTVNSPAQSSLDQTIEESSPSSYSSINNNNNNNTWNNSTCCRRPKWNMDRLRDRWWQTLKYRQLFRQVIIEVEHFMKGRIVDPPDDYDGSVSSKRNIDDESLVPSDCNDIIYLEPVNTKMHHNQEQDENSLLQDLIRTKHESSKSYIDILQDAIATNDESVLKGLIAWCRDDQQKDQLEENKLQKKVIVNDAINRCVRQDKPHLLRIVFNHANDCFEVQDRFSKDSARGQASTPFMIAAELGHVECLSVLLSKQEHNSTFISSRDSSSRNVFHYCCHGQGDESVLKLLLKQLGTGPKSKQQQLSKMLLGKNDSGKTPLHIACERGRVDLVETFLSICSTALLSKMLSITDNDNQTPLLAAVAANSTDAVIALIMWRGNQHFAYQRIQQGDKSEQNLKSSCPLVWAAERGNLEMIHLLLQFLDSSGCDYRITEAISFLLLSPATDDIKSDGIEVLVHAGGNPFADVILPKNNGKSETAVNIASRVVCTEVLQIVIEAGRKELKNRQTIRRRDPKLRQQPESFFQSMEATENGQMTQALKAALVESLFYGWRHHREHHYETSSQHFSSAVTLYKHGAQLVESDLLRLRASLHTASIVTDTPFLEKEGKRCFVTKYQQRVLGSLNGTLKVMDIDRTNLAPKSHLLCRMTWLRDEIDSFGCSCPWLSSNYSMDHNSTESREDKVILVANDNVRFVVHGLLVSQKSVKLASAIRFARMNKESSTANKYNIPEIRLDVDPRLCRFMLQHIYHGSVSTGWSKSDETVCQDILDLMIFAEEALCTSLIQECEMRLLSSDPRRCFCWSCAKSVRVVSTRNHDSSVECMYHVEGPSLLLTGKTALDALAIVQYLESLRLDYDINILTSSLSALKCMTSSKAWTNMENWAHIQAIWALRDIIIQTILLNFKGVIKSDTFKESIELNQEFTTTDALTQQVLLLQTSLEELFNSSLPMNFGKYNHFGKKITLKECL